MISNIDLYKKKCTYICRVYYSMLYVIMFAVYIICTYTY